MRWMALLSALAITCAFAETISGTVTKVIDGDRLVVRDAANKRYKQPFFIEASQSLAELCHGKEAKVEWSERDAKKRYIGYVTCAGKDANAEQLKRGMAWASPRSTKPTSGLYELETYARLRRIGLWADDNAIAPWQWGAQKR